MKLAQVTAGATDKTVRQFGLFFLPAFVAAFGFLVWHWSGSWDAAVTFWIAGAIAAVGAALSAKFCRLVYTGLMTLTLPIGWVVLHLLLSVIYFGVITPIGLLMRLVGRDGLQLKTRPPAESLWSAREASPTERYLRQF